MNFVNEENKRKTDQIIADMKEFTVLADDSAPSARVEGLGVVPGLGLHAEAEAIRTMTRDMEEGIFKTLVMGKFKNGKSTFINALVGKMMMASKATACTAVIATVEYGDQCDMVNVIYTDRPPQRITLKEFTDRFALSEEDEKMIEDNGKLDRFENVSHVEMHSQDEMFKDGLHLIDSPGLEEASARTKTTTEFVPRANAIIFTLNATSLFSAKEKECIAENFAGKHMRNVFFVINRIDNLTPGQLEESVIPGVRAGLEEVFLDADGNFDEELYNNRVFFTNAYGAQCVRTNEPYKVIVGKKEVPVDIRIEDTGMPEFEEALRNFLNSGERIHATFSSALSGIANTYQSAAKRVSAEIAFREQSAGERKRRTQEAKAELDNAVAEVEGIRSTVKSYGGTIAQKTYLDLISYAQTDLPREFAAAAKTPEMQTKFGMGKLLKLSTSMVAMNLPLDGIKKWGEEKQQAVLQPFADKINQYIARKMEEEWPKRVPILIKQEIEDLRQELDSRAEEFDVSLEKAVNLFATGNAKVSQQKGSGLKMGLQALIALSNWDISLATEGMAEGGLKWGEFAKRVALQLVLDGAVTLVLGAPFLIPALIIEVLCMKHKSNQMADQLLSSIGNRAFEELCGSVKKKEMQIKKEIVDQYVKHGEKLAGAGDQLVAEHKILMDRLLTEDAKDTNAARTENNRLKANLDKMHELVEDVYKELYGRVPTEAEFHNLSKTEKAK